ncbi:MAG: hypothetical protein ACHQUC_05295 [Chlamydiales bacterium]
MKIEKFNDFCIEGMKWGCGVAIVPVTVTAAITYSKVIITAIFIDTIMNALTTGPWVVTYYAPGLVEVPALWMASMYFGYVGISIITASFLALIISKTYENCQSFSDTFEKGKVKLL